MGASHNPYKPGERVRVRRGEGWLTGTVDYTKQSTVFVKLDDNDKIVQEHYSETKPA